MCYTAQLTVADRKHKRCFSKFLINKKQPFLKKSVLIDRLETILTMNTIFTSQLLFLILFFPLLGKTQQVTLSGKVLDSKTGKALKNVSIFEANSKIGTITDDKGYFKLVLSEGILHIQISDDGFKAFSEHLVLKNDTILNVDLEPEINSKNRLKDNVGLQADAQESKKGSGKSITRRSRR